jgi:hypothetical protein
MPEVFGRPHGPRLVRSQDNTGWLLIGEVDRVMDDADLLWLRETIEAAYKRVIIDRVFGGR